MTSVKTITMAVLVALIGSASAARPSTTSILVRPNELATNKHVIDAVNSNDTMPWVAGENEMFKGMTMDEAKKLLGTFMTPSYYMFPEEGHTQVKTYEDAVKAQLPDSFDSRMQWPSYIHEIRNQQQCGSCWAFAASEALSDRFAIASNGDINVVLSPEDMVQCDKTDMGCQGGWMNKAWEYLTDFGIVTDACDPYISGQGNSFKTYCPSNFTPPKCANSSVEYKKYKTKNNYHLTTVEDIQQDILTNGPVEGAFMVPPSFFNYKSGVFVPQPNEQPVGGHAIKILGWGTENDIPYWLCANSWGTTWGDLGGFFKIKRGDDTCNIEDQVYAGLPLLEN